VVIWLLRGFGIALLLVGIGIFVTRDERSHLRCDVRQVASLSTSSTVRVAPSVRMLRASSLAPRPATSPKGGGS
jgi:hypothetical protein